MTCLTMNDLLSKTPDQILPTERSSCTSRKICDMFVDFHHKEKAIGNNVFLYMNMFIRLLSCKAHPYVLIKDNIYHADDVVNFYSFHYSRQQYGKFADEFISRYEDEIQKTLEKHVGRIWKKLETSSIYVSTLVNNFRAFVKMPPDMSRSACLLKVCEFTNLSFGFLHMFIFASDSVNIENDEMKKRYFEGGLRQHFNRCSLTDLERLKSLVWKFMGTCRNTGSCLWKINKLMFVDMLQSEQSEIIFCYSRFVSKVIGQTTTTQYLFEKLMSSSMRMYIHNGILDLNEIYTFKKVIIMNKLLTYNILQVEPTS